MTHLINNGETTNGETKTEEPYIPSLDRIEDKLSYFLGKLVEHHVSKKYIWLERHIVTLVDTRAKPVVLVTDQLESELDELKSKTDDFMDRDQVRELITEMNAERDSERDDAVDSSAYVKIEDLESTVKEYVEKYNLIDADAGRDLIRDFINSGEISIAIDDATFSIEA